MSHNINTQILEDAASDFDTFIAQRNWDGALAVIDNIADMGFAHEAELLQKAYDLAYQKYAESYEGQKEYEDSRVSYPKE